MTADSQTNRFSRQSTTRQSRAGKQKRKRASTRRMRRFEGVLAQLPVVQMDWRATLQGVEAPAVLLPTPWVWSKLLSGLLLAAALSAFTLIHWQDEWYLYNEQIGMGNLGRLSAAELTAAMAVDGWNIFWIEPEDVRQRLLTHHWVADAQVEVGLPTAMHVRVTERMPVAVWLTNAGGYWVTAEGVTFPMTEAETVSAAAWPQIVDSLGEARDRYAESETPRLDAQILQTSLALVEALPELAGQVRYNRGIGLNFPLQDPAIWVYWGDGSGMEEKFENLEASRTVLRQGDGSAQILDIRFAGRPYLR